MTPRQSLIENNLGLVHSCATKFKGRGVEYDDLFQAGCVGLIKAANGFDESLGYVFSTYAVPAILGEIKRIFRDGGAIKVGRALKEKARFVRLEAEKLSNELNREPTVSELSEYLGLTPCEVSELLTINLPVISLTSPQNEEEEKQLDVPVESEEERIAEKLSLDECIYSLEERDRLLIELRYFKSQTQSCVAKKLGMTQVQVSRREKKILEEIREKLTV